MKRQQQRSIQSTMVFLVIALLIVSAHAIVSHRPKTWAFVSHPSSGFPQSINTNKKSSFFTHSLNTIRPSTLQALKNQEIAIDNNDHEEVNQTNDNEKETNVGVPLPQRLQFRGKVDKGYGRGGKKLGVPTANLPESLFSTALQNITAGVYFGWALIEEFSDDKQETKRRKGRNVPHKAVVNVGYSPTFSGQENPEKIVEAHLILDHPDTDMEGDFYKETMRLVLSGFLREEQKFDSFPDLISQIHFDIDCAKEALTNVKAYADLKGLDFLDVSVQERVWVGRDGGDGDASWEFVDQVIDLH